MNRNILKSVVLIMMVIFLVSCQTHNNLYSPDRMVAVSFTLDTQGQPSYSVLFKQNTVISNAALRLHLQNDIGSEGFEIIDKTTSTLQESYTLPVGKTSLAENHFNELTITLADKKDQDQKLLIVFRAYNDGIALRYRIPQNEGQDPFVISSEQTEFRFAEDHKCWALRLENFNTNYESEYEQVTLDSIKPGDYIGCPLTIEIKDGPFVLLTEADLTDYAGMYLQGAEGKAHTLVSRLSPHPDNPAVAVNGTTPHNSPWRVIMISETAGGLIESDLITNLNDPCALDDVSWIKPGKVAWPWWSGRTVKNVRFNGGMNTATMKHYIDFASEFGLEYLLIDALWYGPHKDPEQDITTTIPEIDMPGIIAYAKSKNVDVMVWINWENTRRQMDKAFALYEKWGIKGIKIDYMNRDDQEVVNFYHNVVKKAAEHHLLVNFHGAYKPTGLRRTYPNFVTREGVLGLEHTKWSTRVTPEHNVTLPFTRMVPGPMDYTPGSFLNVTREAFKSRYEEPVSMGTRAHHLAMFVVYDSPLQMVSDYPSAYREQAGSEFIKSVPASWEKTKVLQGKISDYIAIARQNGNEWFLGAMTDWDARILDIPLDFLGEGEYTAHIYMDADDAGVNPTHLLEQKKQVTKKDSLQVVMQSGGGYAVHFKPVSDI